MTSLPLVDESGINCLAPACGACCREQAYLPLTWYTIEGMESLPKEVQDELEDERFKLNTHGWPSAELSGQPCMWLNLETMQCKHYEHRPEICRELTPGDSSCWFWREEYEIK